MYNKIGAILFIFILSKSYAQIEPVARQEFVISGSYTEDYEVDLLHEDGLLLTKRHDGFNGKEKWFFSKYDTTLKHIWTAEYKIEFGLKPIVSHHDNLFLYWLFEESDTEKFRILRLDLHTGETDEYLGNFHAQPDITQFKVLGNMAYIGGYWRDRPTVLAFSIFDKSIKALPHLYLPDTELKSIEIDEQSKEVNVVLYTMKRNTCQFSIKTYSYDGKMVRTTNVSSDSENALISGKILPIVQPYSLMVGNFAQGCTDYSQGLYMTRLNNGEPEKIEWIDFSKLENFFNYLKPRRKEKVVNKINKQKEEGREPKFRYRLLVHDLIKNDKELILIAEVYYPISKSGTVAGGALQNIRNKKRESDFDAYRFTHAIVCGFDIHTSKLLWDNCFTIKELENQELVEMVQVSKQGDKLVLAYPYKGKIHTELIYKNEVVRQTEIFDIKSTDEKIRDNEDEALAAWYDTYFLAYGFQKIDTKKLNEGTKEVFFMSKLRYNPNAPIVDKNATKK